MVLCYSAERFIEVALTLKALFWTDGAYRCAQETIVV